MPAPKNFKPGSDKAFKLAEKELQRMMESGKVNPNNISKVKNKIAKKYGAYPLGATN